MISEPVNPYGSGYMLEHLSGPWSAGRNARRQGLTRDLSPSLTISPPNVQQAFLQGWDAQDRYEKALAAERAPDRMIR